MVVLGAKTQIDNYLNMRGLEPKNVRGYRITDEDAMLAAMEAAGTSRMLVEAHLSKVRLLTLPSHLCHGGYAHTVMLGHVMLPAYACMHDLSLPAPGSIASARQTCSSVDCTLLVTISAKCNAVLHTACATQVLCSSAELYLSLWAC